MVLLRYEAVAPHCYAVHSSHGNLLGVVHRDLGTIGAWVVDGDSEHRYPTREAAAWALVPDMGEELFVCASQVYEGSAA